MNTKRAGNGENLTGQPQNGKRRARGAADSGPPAAPDEPKSVEFVIAQRRISSIALEVVGVSPLIQNNFSQKAVEQMLRKHMGLSVQREKKVPRDCIRDATIMNTSGAICLPPTGFKKAMLTAAGQIKDLKKTHLRTQLFVEGGSIPISYDEMVPLMSMVRTSGMARTPDVRFRPMFTGWRARLVIQFADLLRVETVVDLLNRAGSVGVGEWRPEKDGTHGVFKVARAIDRAEEIAEVRDICAPSLVPLVIPGWAMDASIDPALLSRIAGGQGPESDAGSGGGEEMEDDEDAATNAS